MRKVRKAPVARVTTAKLRKQLDDRTLERDEALEQLAATSEVLKVISGSHGELEPVFQSICARRPFRSGNLSTSRRRAMFLSRERVEPFGKNQIEFVETFADQAVIA